ncbi:DUF3887 domain-containing protein [Streptomyces olivochromogenes]|uniref:Uncharacterized protein n=1 Tax=Streptomyces olivochromogenes TaxID=1963 RepID=A0A250VRA8_STROL|nr:DUF3887 domain-containing protein [Streptomyces olivochromogenes]KUN42575.1 hypothetical protein AQJ27_35915 [Streptomyces olivochromogenes]GAX56614.1 hypothetical protein SO3561_08182 [Streptomyces olivochromogenes]
MFSRPSRFSVAVTIASSALVLVTGTVSSAMPDTTDTAVVAPPPVTAPSPPPYKQLALKTLDQVVKGNFVAVSARFDESIRQEGNPAVLANAWKEYQDQLGFGRYQSHREPRQVVSGDRTVVDIPLRMAEQPGDLRVVFDGKGHIEGLWFLKKGVPVP